MNRISTIRKSRQRSISTLSDYWDALNKLYYGGNSYHGLEMILPQAGGERITASFGSHAHALKSSSILFAAVSLHVRVFSQVEFAFQQLTGSPAMGKLFTSQALQPLQEPWPNGTSGELLASRCLDVDLAGNSFIAVRPKQRLKRMHPEWVTLAIQSETDPESPEWQLDAEVVGYIYTPGGAGSGNKSTWLDVHEVSHWSPFPDPEMQFIGMSPITPVLQELQIDSELVEYKTRFLKNGAVPGLAVSPKSPMTEQQATEFMDLLKQSSSGVRNAGKTMFLNGADLTVVGADLKKLDAKREQGALESRLAAALGVPAGLVGFSEGMAANTYSNLNQARRILSDTTLHYLWRSCCAASAHLVTVPKASRLWYESKHVPFLADDSDRQATIQAAEANTIRALTDGGYDPASVVDALLNGADWSKLKHSGLMSVQLLPPGSGEPDGNT